MFPHCAILLFCISSWISSWGFLKPHVIALWHIKRLYFLYSHCERDEGLPTWKQTTNISLSLSLSLSFFLSLSFSASLSLCLSLSLPLYLYVSLSLSVSLSMALSRLSLFFSLGMEHHFWVCLLCSHACQIEKMWLVLGAELGLQATTKTTTVDSGGILSETTAATLSPGLHYSISCVCWPPFLLWYSFSVSLTNSLIQAHSLIHVFTRSFTLAHSSNYFCLTASLALPSSFTHHSPFTHSLCSSLTVAHWPYPTHSIAHLFTHSSSHTVVHRLTHSLTPLAHQLGQPINFSRSKPQATNIIKYLSLYPKTFSKSFAS